MSNKLAYVLYAIMIVFVAIVFFAIGFQAMPIP